MTATSTLAGSVKAQGGAKSAADWLIAERRKVPKRSAADMIDAVLVVLNQQLETLLRVNETRDLDDEQLDRMIRINSAAIAIARAQNAEPPDDPRTATDDELRAAAKKGRR